MIANWLKILLFAAGGITAAAGTAYYTGIYDPWASRDTGSPVASAPEAPAQQGSQTASDEGAVEQSDDTAIAPETDASSQDDQIAALPQADESAEATQNGEGEDPAVPSFHIVRVEPDGSMVIAGSAEPNSEIEVVAGAHVIARADVGPSGDFAALLDDTLDPGDYQIVLRSTGPGEGQVTTSLETAIVSVPDSASGQVLALVEEPGAASRLITVPDADALQEDANAADDAEREITAAEQAQAGTDARDEPAETATQAGTTTSQAEVARADPQPTGETQSRPASPRNTLAVEAIEIEGNSVFVAGRGTAGTTVR
ncbi:MAG: peptigoglycan-binding protein LysM, partial [Aliihoeflea sp.]